MSIFPTIGVMEQLYASQKSHVDARYAVVSGVVVGFKLSKKVVCNDFRKKIGFRGKQFLLSFRSI